MTVSSLNAGVGCLKNRRDVSFKSEHLPFYLCVAERKTVVEVTPCRSLLSVVGFLCVFFFPLKVAPEGRVPLRLTPCRRKSEGRASVRFAIHFAASAD